MSDISRYESQLRIAVYKAITDLLSRQSLITDNEEKRIRQHITSMQDALIKPSKKPHTHDRDLSTM